MNLYNITNAETGRHLEPIAANTEGGALLSFARKHGHANYGDLSRTEDVTLRAEIVGRAYRFADGTFAHDPTK